MKLSAIIITHNEETNIARCLQSVSFADERVVVDSESTDRTVEIATQYGAHVFIRKWEGYGKQKNFGLQQAQGEWALFIDADEEVTSALQRGIQQAIANSTVNFFWLRIVTVFLRKPLRHLYGHNPRLFRKSAGQWTAAAVHEQVGFHDDESFVVVQLDDHFSQVLQEPLLHHSHPTLASYLHKMHKYTTLDAAQMSKSGRHRSGRAVSPSWRLPYHLALRQFFKLLVYRQGFRDGWTGLMWCAMSGYYEYEMGVKFLAEAKNLNSKLKMKKSKI